jgi:hypothetical protein
MSEPLLPESSDWHGQYENWSAIQELITVLENRILPSSPDKDEWFGWEPLPIADFMHGMAIVKNALGSGTHRFLDIGCGIGSKVYLAKYLGFDAHGLERHDPYRTVAQDVFDVQTELGWAQEYSGYSSFSVLYCYSLTSDSELQSKLNHYITDQIPKGTIFFSAGGPYPDWLEHIGGQVWRA